MRQHTSHRRVHVRFARITLFLLLSLPTLPFPLGAQPTDTSKVVSTSPLFTRDDAFIAAGFAVATVALFPADRYFARRLQDSTTQSNRFLRHQATNVRLVTESSLLIGGGLYAIGRLAGNDRMADLGLHGTESVAIGLGVVSVFKGIAGRARPLVDVKNPRDFKFGRGFKEENFRSFPSGHTVMAFSAAAAVTAETARWWPKSRYYVGTAMYGGAALTGVSRMFNNKHWASDVAVGALIGTFAGRKVVRYHHSHPGNKIDKWLLKGSVIPDGHGGSSLALTIFP